MRLTPRKEFAVLSPLRPEEARLRLEAAIGSPWPRSDQRPFSGRFDGMSFDMMRSSRGRNSFRPRIRGTVESSLGGSRIQGTMQVHEVVLVVVGFIISFPTLLSVQLMLESMTTRRWDLPAFLLGAAVVGVIAMVTLSFAYESRRALRDLKALLENESPIS